MEFPHDFHDAFDRPDCRHRVSLAGAFRTHGDDAQAITWHDRGASQRVTIPPPGANTCGILWHACFCAPASLDKYDK